MPLESNRIRRKVMDDMLMNSMHLRKKIIFVDDVEFSLISVKDRLKKHYEVYTAQSVDRLFEVLSHVKPDLILLDVNMPRANGYDAIKKLKTDDRYASIPVVFLTCKSDKMSVRKGFDLGAADYVAKPFTDSDLIERIECQLNPDPEKNKKIWEEESTRKKVFFVDDVNFSLVSVRSRLKEYYEVYPLQSAADLYEILQHVKPDLILLDINMPHVDGYEVIKKLKADERYAPIPVIFLTSKSDKESMVKGFNLGAADYVAKPFSDLDLIDSIEHQLNPKKSDYLLQDEVDDGRPSILAVDEAFNMLDAMQHALSDDYDGPLLAVVQKKFSIYYALRDRYKVYMNSSQDEMVEFLQQKTPDMFLLDYDMLEANGFALISVIREYPEHRDTPIILITPEGTTADQLTAALYIGACDYVDKAFEPQTLREKVAKYIKKTDTAENAAKETEGEAPCKK
jgi:CheY-like chemotaxis protein